MEACTNPDILKVIAFFLIIIDIVKIIIPIGLIIIGTIDFAKAVITNDENNRKKTINLFTKRMIYAILVFAVPWLVEVLMVSLGDLTAEINFTDCIDNTNNIAYYEELQAELEKQQEEEEKKKLEERRLKALEEAALKNSIITGEASEGNFIGQKYTFTEEQIRGIAMQCQSEQSSVIGSAAEASLMANRFELYGSKYGEGGTGLFNYVETSGWFAHSKEHMHNTAKLKEANLTAVIEVLVFGNRTLPLYIDDHDCIDCGKYGFDVIKIITNGTTITDKKLLVNHDYYVKDQTIIYNKYGGEYTFYTFPTERSDPFGYTDKALKKIKSLNS